MQANLIEGILSDLKVDAKIDPQMRRSIAASLNKAGDLLRGPATRDGILLGALRILVKDRQFAEVLALEPLLSAELLQKDVVARWLDTAKKVRARERRPTGPRKAAAQARPLGLTRDQMQEIATWDQRYGAGELSMAKLHVHEPTIDDFFQQWGPVPDSLDEVLQSDWPGLWLSSRQWVRHMDWLAPLRNDIPASTDTAGIIAMLDRIRKGQGLASWIRLTWKLETVLTERATEPTHEEQRFLDRMGQLNDYVDMPDMSELNETIAAGRTVVFAGTHQGFFHVAHRLSDSIELPGVMITRNGVKPENEPEDSDNIWFSASEGTPIEFLKVVKKVRKRQYKILIYPDGHQGDVEHVDFLGSKIDYGTGVNALAWHGKAVFYCITCTFENGRFKVRLVRGPDASEYSDQSLFAEDCKARYLQSQREILQSPFENLRVLKRHVEDRPAADSRLRQDGSQQAAVAMPL